MSHLRSDELFISRLKHALKARRGRLETVFFHRRAQIIAVVMNHFRMLHCYVFNTWNINVYLVLGQHQPSFFLS